MITAKFKNAFPVRYEFTSDSITDLHMVEKITQCPITNHKISFPPDNVLLHRILTEVDDRLDFPLRGHYKKWLEMSQLLKEVKLGQKSVKFNTTVPLREYQISSASFLLLAQKAILCDETGMGKTPAALVAAMEVGTHILIVTQAYLKYNMKKEIVKWYPELEKNIFIMEGTRKQREQTIYDAQAFTEMHPGEKMFLITNVESISIRTNDPYRKLQYPWVLDKLWDVIIVDESHRYTKLTTQRNMGLSVLQGNYIFFLQGHLVNKGEPSKLFPLLKMMDPYRFPNYWQYCNKYCEIEYTSHGKKIVGANIERLEEWKEIMSEYLLQRFKEDYINDMPEKIFKELYIPMDKKHRDIYNDFKEKNLKEGMPSSHKLGLITNLRRLLLNPEKLGYPAYHPTENVLLELLQDTPSAIIFGWYKDSIHSVSNTLRANKIPHVTITGDITDFRERNRLVEKFQSGEVPFLLGTMASCGQGLNLDITSNVIFIEPDWDPANVQQAIDRAHRVSTAGRNIPLTITTLIIKGTIQEDIYEMCMSKKEKISEMAVVDELIHSLKRR